MYIFKISLSPHQMTFHQFIFSNPCISLPIAVQKREYFSGSPYCVCQIIQIIFLELLLSIFAFFISSDVAFSFILKFNRKWATYWKVLGPSLCTAFCHNIFNMLHLWKQSKSLQFGSVELICGCSKLILKETKKKKFLLMTDLISCNLIFVEEITFGLC